MINIRKLEAELWASADLLRAESKLTSNQYCMPVLGLIFLRYAYGRFKMVEAEILKNRPSRNGRVLPVEASDFAEKSALFLPTEAQYDYLLNLPADIAAAGLLNTQGEMMNSLGEVVNNAMELVEQQSEQLSGVLPKDYTIFSDTLLESLLRIFGNSALSEVGGDVIGRIYEYFLNKFAKNIASDDGVFFTPKSLVKMIVNILEPTSGILLDPACGSGGMFVQTGDFVNQAGMVANNITERTFGGYISIYDFKRAVDDGATVPLYYENRGEKILNIENPDINDRILNAIEDADLDVSQQEKLEREFAKEIHLLTAEPRLDSIAKDFVGHYSDLWTSGKAMFVCLNKVTCVRMYDLVQKYWAQEIASLEETIKYSSQQEVQELSRKLKWMRETEMAVVISQEQNEIQTFKKWGLDILPHRAKMEKRELDKEFKDKNNPFRVVFVCAMWLTGFDVKCLSCLYLDKPLKAHTLMQTIARANRVAEGKSNGLIIDYIGIVKALRKALADYTANVGGQGGTDPTIDKEKLIARIHEIISAATGFLHEHGFDLKSLVDARRGTFEQLSLIEDATNAMCESMETKKEYQTYASELARLMKYTDRNDIPTETKTYKDAILAIYAALQKRRKHSDNTDLMVEINHIVNDYLEVEPRQEGIMPSKRFDISNIDFDLLAKEFSKKKKQNLAMKDLQELLKERIDQMLRTNPGRIDYMLRYQEIIAEYNGEQDQAAIEKAFKDLMDLAKNMDQEQKRYVREGFSSDEELSIYDLLFSESLSKKDILAIKKVAVDVLTKVKEKIAELDHWTDKQETKATVDNLIRDTLWAELPECYDELSISGYRQKIYEYIYTRYKEVA